MKKLILASTVLFSAVAAATARATMFLATGGPINDPPKSGATGVSPMVWVIIAVVVIAGAFFLLKGKKK
jgi:LPXTG-motif cell wall-anchored protein